VQIGWVHDTGLRRPDEEGAAPRREAITTDLRSLFRGYDATLAVHGGDMVNSDQGKVPHISAPGRYDTFWDVARELGVEDRVWAVPGNHDVPIQRFFAAHPNAVWRRQFRFPEARTALFLLNTNGGGGATGSHGPTVASGQTAVGVNHGYVPHVDLLWLEEQLRDLPDSWAKLLVCHHHLYWSDDESLATYSPEPAHRSRNFYDVVLNARRVHDLLSRHSRVVACQAHLFQRGTEGNTAVDGVHYLHKSHYHMGGEFSTFGVIDARPDRTRVLTVDHESRREAVIFDSAEVSGW
jgi:hypothetical protein